MAGRLLELHVQEGDDVDEGQLVAVVESMKMQLEVGAAFAGRVSRLLVAEGDILDGPDVIAEISSVSDSVENPDSSASSNANANAVPIARQLESGARETSPARRRK
jgi:pyruvate/2-oxoglutarate dehydrogenase complex dihydrolipoamide acyltransferase (E2) component